MKNHLLLLFAILIAWPALSLGQSAEFLTNHFGQQQKAPIFPQDFPDLHCNNQFPFNEDALKMAHNDIVIRLDSAYTVHEYRIQKYIYTTDAAGNILTALWQNWENDTWVNYSLTTFTWDEYGNKLSELSQKWENGLWNNQYRWNFTYDERGNRLTSLPQVWSDGNWINHTLINYTYSVSDKMLTYHAKLWIDGAWVNVYQEIYTWENNDHTYTSLEQTWENNEWVNRALNTIIFDTISLTENFLIQDWENGVWLNDGLYTSTFNSQGNVLTQIMEDWDNGSWKNVLFYSSDFYPNGNSKQATERYWDNDEWVNEIQSVYTWDAGKVHAQVFVWIGNEWVESTISNYMDVFMAWQYITSFGAINFDLYFADITGIEEQAERAKNGTIHCYPNPTTNQITIEINPAWKAENCMLELFNQSGQKVKSLYLSPNSTSSTSSINVEDMMSGMYFLKVSSGQKTSTRKVIIE